MGIGVTDMTISLDNKDEADSLANYFNEHGVCAFPQNTAVSCPIENESTIERIELLKQSWQLFWEYSDSGLFGLAVYTKE